MLLFQHSTINKSCLKIIYWQFMVIFCDFVYNFSLSHLHLIFMKENRFKKPQENLFEYG